MKKRSGLAHLKKIKNKKQTTQRQSGRASSQQPTASSRGSFILSTYTQSNSSKLWSEFMRH